MRTTIRHYHIIIFILLACALTACDNDVHDSEYPLPAGQGAIIVGLQSETTPDCLTLYVFDGNGAVAVRKDYTDPRPLASKFTPVKAGAYTVVVVANVPAADLPQQTTVSDLINHLADNAAAYPDMLSAGTQTDVAEGEVKRLLLTLQDGTSGIDLSTVRLLLTLPDKDMPPYSSKGRTRATSEEGTYQLRCIAEVYRQGTSIRVHRRVQLCNEQADGTFLAELLLQPGDYDIRLWADGVTDGTTADKYYNADDLTAVTVLTTNYVANGQTDEKDAYYGSLSLTAPSNEGQPGSANSSSSPTGGGREGAVEVAVSLLRPLARYRILATDVVGYENLIANGDDLPPIEELTVRVAYETFFPTGFNVATGRPNDALTGISYSAGIIAAEGYDPAETRQVGADYVLTNGEESFVTATVQTIDRRTGEAISTVSGVRIPYRRGQLTTVSGTFLTAGRTAGGVQIDTEWGEEIVIEF